MSHTLLLALVLAGAAAAAPFPEDASGDERLKPAREALVALREGLAGGLREGKDGAETRSLAEAPKRAFDAILDKTLEAEPKLKEEHAALKSRHSQLIDAAKEIRSLAEALPDQEKFRALVPDVFDQSERNKPKLLAFQGRIEKIAAPLGISEKDQIDPIIAFYLQKRISRPGEPGFVGPVSKADKDAVEAEVRRESLASRGQSALGNASGVTGDFGKSADGSRERGGSVSTVDEPSAARTVGTGGVAGSEQNVAFVAGRTDTKTGAPTPPPPPPPPPTFTSDRAAADALLEHYRSGGAALSKVIAARGNEFGAGPAESTAARAELTKILRDRGIIRPGDPDLIDPLLDKDMPSEARDNRLPVLDHYFQQYNNLAATPNAARPFMAVGQTIIGLGYDGLKAVGILGAPGASKPGWYSIKSKLLGTWDGMTSERE